MVFAPAAEKPGLLHHKLAKNVGLTEGTSGKFTADQDYVNRVTISGQRQWFHNVWFRKGVDPMRANGSVFTHCKFGDEHLPLLDPMRPDLGFFDWARRAPQNSYWDGSQWCPDGQFLWCEYTGHVIDGTKIGPGMFLEDSYVHDVMRNRTDFYVTRDPKSTDLLTHNDGIQCLQATRQCGVRRSRIEMRQEHMSAFMIQPVSADIVDFVIEDNFIDAKYAIYLISKDASGGKLRKVTIRNNVFSDGVVWALVGKYLDRSVTQLIWENNKFPNGAVLTLDNALKNPTPR